eukprot:2641754-Rhodomonas_salina.1
MANTLQHQVADYQVSSSLPRSQCHGAFGACCAVGERWWWFVGGSAGRAFSCGGAAKDGQELEPEGRVTGMGGAGHAEQGDPGDLQGGQG